jgi:DNA/RNA endonuclease YhcR with UshA esterase domain
MTKACARLVVLSGFLLVGVAGVNVGLQAHHAVAGVYDLNKEVVLQGVLKKLNFTNPHASIELTVANPDGTFTDWVLTTASITTLTREGINKTSMKPGEILKVTILPARNGNPAGFIRNLQLGDREIRLFFGDGRD